MLNRSWVYQKLRFWDVGAGGAQRMIFKHLQATILVTLKCLEEALHVYWYRFDLRNEYNYIFQDTVGCGKQKQPEWFEEINRMQLTIECSDGEWRAFRQAQHIDKKAIACNSDNLSHVRGIQVESILLQAHYMYIHYMVDMESVCLLQVHFKIYSTLPEYLIV